MGAGAGSSKFDGGKIKSIHGGSVGGGVGGGLKCSQKILLKEFT